MGKREFPMYGATQAMLAAAEYRPSPKRLTLSEVTRQMASLKANLARIDMRVSKAEAQGERMKLAKLLELQERSRVQFVSLVAEYQRLGGTVILES